jgi:hypothetical protein
VNYSIKFGSDIWGAYTGKSVWLKVGGWKSGVKTCTNYEQLVALRVVKDTNGLRLDIAEYTRKHGKINVKILRSFRERSEGIEIIYSGSIEKWDGRMRIPAWPWGGGNGSYSDKPWSFYLSYD